MAGRSRPSRSPREKEEEGTLAIRRLKSTRQNGKASPLVVRQWLAEQSLWLQIGQGREADKFCGGHLRDGSGDVLQAFGRLHNEEDAHGRLLRLRPVPAESCRWLAAEWQPYILAATSTSRSVERSYSQ